MRSLVKHVLLKGQPEFATRSGHLVRAICLALVPLLCAVLVSTAPAFAREVTGQQGYIWDSRDTSDPRSCLAAMSEAIEAYDADAFDRRVAIESIAGDVFAELEAVSQDENLSQWLPPVITLMASQGVFTNVLTSSFLAGEVREFVLYGVGSGAFAGNMTKDYQSSSVLAPLFSLVSMGRKEIRSVGRPERLDRNRMRLSFAVYDYDNSNTYAVQGVFTKVSDGWKLTSIENLRDLILQIGVESQQGMVLKQTPGHFSRSSADRQAA